MKIGFADDKNKNDIYELWESVFGDSKNDIDLFMEESFQNENTLVCYDTEKLVSMLFLLPEEICFKGKAYPAYYIYAAATKPAYRKQGIMGKMLDFADGVCKNRNIPFLFLVPANDRLFDYYNKFGFRTAIYKKTIAMSYETAKKYFTQSDFKPQFGSDVTRIAELKDEVFCNQNDSYIKWRQNEISLFQKYLISSGGKIVTSDYGYTAFLQSGSSKEIYEFCAKAENIVKLMCALSDGKETNEFNFNLSKNFPFISDTQKFVRVGMIKQLADIDIKASDVYIGITLS